MTNAEKFKEVFSRDLEESRMLSMPSSFNQIIALKSFQIVGVDCADEWRNAEYQGEPTIPLSVIEDISKQLEELINKPCLNQNMMAQNLAYRNMQEIIDKAVKEIKDER